MNWPDAVDGAAVQRVVDAQAFLALERSSRDAIEAWQALHLRTLLEWLTSNVPWWRERLGPGIDVNKWTDIPPMSRFQLWQMVNMHGAAPVPEQHGAVMSNLVLSEAAGSGRYFISAFAQRLVNHAFYADHLRQGRNPFLPQACIADDVPLHSEEHLLVEASLAAGVGRQALRNFGLFSKADHLRWIGRTQPAYLTVRPDWFEAALVQAAANHVPLPEIRQLLTFGATATDSLRRKARRWLGASVRHRYTCAVCGPLAFQCPRSDDFHHVAVGNVKVEIVDADGALCPVAAPGATPRSGRVLVTALHQYATPLVRFDTGDRAALHDGCPGCGLEVATLSALREKV